MPQYFWKNKWIWNIDIKHVYSRIGWWYVTWYSGTLMENVAKVLTQWQKHSALADVMKSNECWVSYSLSSYRVPLFLVAISFLSSRFPDYKSDSTRASLWLVNIHKNEIQPWHSCSLIFWLLKQTCFRFLPLLVVQVICNTLQLYTSPNSKTLHR